MPVDKLIENDQIVQALASSLVRGGHSLQDVPGLLKRVLHENMWIERKLTQAGERTGEAIRYYDFKRFVADKPPDGLGATIDLLFRLCADDKETVTLLDQVMTGNRGNPTGHNQYSKNGNSYNITNSSSDNTATSGRGTSQRYALRRLRRQRPDLHAKVLADEISPNAAMIEAGFRTKTISIPIDPERAARSIRRHFDEDQLEELVDLLS